MIGVFFSLPDEVLFLSAIIGLLMLAHSFRSFVVYVAGVLFVLFYLAPNNAPAGKIYRERLLQSQPL